MTLDQALQRLKDANEPVPKPLRRPTPAEVDAAEREIGIPFHADYRRYLLEASHVVFGHREPGVVLPEMRGSHLDLHEMISGARTVGVPNDVLPFCEDNGNYFCINSAGTMF